MQIQHNLQSLLSQLNILLGTTKANVERVCVSIYITQTTLLENGNPNIWTVQPHFKQNKMVKTTKIETSLGTTKANVERVGFSVYITQITPLENGDYKVHKTEVEYL